MSRRAQNAGKGVIQACLRGLLCLQAAWLWPVPAAQAHNLDQIDTSINFDDDFINLMKVREENEEVLIQDGDEFWMVFRSTPGPGTDTGAGGYLTFYIPTNYVDVLEVSYLTPSPGTPGTPEAPTNFTRVPLKGASIIAVGSGTIAPASTPALAGLTLTNAFGQAEAPVTATGLHRGTIAGVYADTGIFFSQDPRTLYQSWACAPETGPLSRRGYPVTLVNNRGESITPVTRYDAEQLIAYGRADAPPVVDPNGRGNAPWGLANVVAGPLCGYAWQFDLNAWLDTSNMQAACSTVGPWQRIKYPGSQYSRDQAGLISAALGYAGVDASSLGFALGADPGESQLPGDANAIRVSYGMLELGRPEYAAVRIRVKHPPAFECFTITTDAFGGDAGGLDAGKDHEWRYYDPTVIVLNPCTYLSKVPSDPIVRPGENFYFDVTFINNGMAAYTNVVLTDTLPSGLTFQSADPPQNSGPNPLVWNLGPVGINEMRQFRIYMRAASVGTFFNRVVATSGTNVLAEAMGVVEVSYRSLLRGDKTVAPEFTTPGGSVEYTLTVYNDGAGSSGVPLVINELLPEGFTYAGMVDQVINGHHLPDPFLVINSANPNRPIFTIRDGIYAGQTLVLKFTAAVNAAQPAGTYCNSYYLTFEGKVIGVPPQACVTVGGAQIGDTVFRDWDGDGVQDAGEEGLPGVLVNLYAGSCPATGTVFRALISDTNGGYRFTGLEAGSYCVSVATNTAPAGYTLTTANPIGVALLENEVNTNADFGFRPAGTGTIGARIFDDKNGDGAYDGADAGITNVTVWLYEDSNGDGTLESGDLLLRTTNSAVGGGYAFTNLAAGLNYLVDADDADADLAAYFSPNSFSATTPSLRAVPNLTGTNVTADFGYLANLPSSIGDMVFIDVNFNGTYDTNDLPLPDVTVLLYRSGGGLEPLDTQVSDLTGRYLFTNLPPDTYLVEVDANDLDVPGGLGIVVAQHLVALAANSSYLDADFAFQRFIGKSVDKAYAVTNELLTYTVGVGYPGDEPLEDARVIDPLPAGVTFSNANAGGVYGAYVPLPAMPGIEQAPRVELAITNPVADTYVRQDSPTLNYDAGQRVKVKQEAGKDHVGLMRFDLSEIPEDSLVHEAWFSYNVQNVGNFNTMYARRMLTDWTETGATWNDSGVAGGDWAAGTFGTGDYAATAYGPMSVNPIGWKSNDVTALLKEWIEDARANYGLALVASAANADLAEIYDREDAGTGVAPRLDLVYEEPGNITTTNLLAVSRTVMATGQTVTVTMTLWSSHAISNVTPLLQVNSAAVNISGPAEAVPATVPAMTPTTFTYVCTPLRMDELIFTGLAESEDGYAFVESRSPSVLVSANGTSNVVSWALGTNSAAQGGAAASSGTLPSLYAFQGKTKAFWNYSIMSNTWAAKAQVTDNTDQGAGLAYDGNNLIYGLRGAGTKKFWSYNITANAWTTLKDTPQNVKWGGALVYLDGYVYAFRGDDKTDFWRYDPGANTWSVMAAAPGTVKEGGALTTDGTSIYALRGDGSAALWKYDVASNAWTVLANAPANVKKGGALTYLNGYLYAFKGDDKKDFFRYSLAANTWSKLAALPVNVFGGGGLASDGTYVYALNGDGTKSFWRYNPTAGTWTKMKDALGNVGDGGALVYAKGTAATIRQISLQTDRSLVTSGTVVTVTMEVMGSTTQANVRPSGLTVAGVNGATATLVSGPSPTNLPTLGSNVVGSISWTYLVKSGTGIGSVTFGGSATNSLNQSFGTAVSGGIGTGAGEAARGNDHRGESGALGLHGQNHGLVHSTAGGNGLRPPGRPDSRQVNRFLLDFFCDSGIDGRAGGGV